MRPYLISNEIRYLCHSRLYFGIFCIFAFHLSLMKKQFASILMILSLLLPMGIGMAHAFHQHENKLCLAKNESHFHSDKTNCDQVHYFSQTLSDGVTGFNQIRFKEIIKQNPFNSEFEHAHSFLKSDPDRGPPAIIVL